MRRKLLFGLSTCLPVAISLLLASPATAETRLTISGQVRVRAEGEKKSFDPSASVLQHTDLRTRIGVGAEIESNTHLFVQMQDSRRLGGLASSGEPASGTLADGESVDLHQAFVRVDRLGLAGLGFRAGRFEVDLGNQRVFGSVGWHNAGRSWEGGSLWYETEPVRVTAHAWKRFEPGAAKRSGDFDVFGLYAELPSAGSDLFVFRERDAEKAGGSIGPGVNLLDRWDAGVYHGRAYGPVRVDVNGVYQFGDRALVAGEEAREQDISAFLAAGEIGWRIPGPRKIDLALGADFASGDSDPAGGTYQAYDNLYYTGHKFRGFMDYFVPSRTEGLLDLLGRLSIEPCSGWTFKTDLHYFQTAQDYSDFRGEQTRALGYELDLTLTTTRVAGVRIDGGASLFLPSESFAGADESDPGLWAYAMVTAGFGEEIR
ncbi:MAG: alginate export family protein [Candidatus Eisenbacteria bacterium]